MTIQTLIKIKFKPEKETLIVFAAFFACVGANALASLFIGTPLHVLFYQGLLVLGVCIFFPLWYVGIRNKQHLSTIGLTTKGWNRALLVGLIFVIFSVPWRIVGKDLPFPAMDKFNIMSVLSAIAQKTIYLKKQNLYDGFNFYHLNGGQYGL